MLMRAAAQEYSWTLNYGGIALMWRGGCIIRSRFLGKIKEAFDNNPSSDQPAARRLLPRRDQEGAEGLAQRRRHGREAGHPGAGVQHRAGVLRPVPQRACCPPTCCRRSATTSARTPTSASTSRAASSSTPTGPARAARPRRRPTTSDARPAPARPRQRPPARIRAIRQAARSTSGLAMNSGNALLDEDPAHVVDHRVAHAAQRHDRIAAEVRRDDHVGCRQQHVVGADRLALDHVGRVAADLAGPERGDQRRLVEDLAAAGVDQDHAVVHRRELGRREHPRRLVRQRAVQRDHGALRQQVVEAHLLRVVGRDDAGVDVRVVGDHLGAVAQRQDPRHRLADRADADQADGRAVQIDAERDRRPPAPLAPPSPSRSR